MAIYLDTSNGEYAIWSNPESGRGHSGRCIGVGDTLDAAKRDAMSELQADLAAIDALNDGTEARQEVG